jgi:hypothetical protein
MPTDFTASELVAYARSIADLQNTKFIDHTDEVNLINEAYKDIYARYCESDGDYFVTEIVTQLTPAMLDPNNTPFAYLIDLPSDFFKLRYVSYRYGNQWQPVEKFSMSQRDNVYGVPRYRIKNNQLWILCNSTVPEIKMGYYPIASEITTPLSPLSFFDTLSDFAKLSLRDVSYVDQDQIALYATGNDIKATSLTLGTTVTLVTSVTPSKPMYYRGYVYWISAGDIWRMGTDFLTTLSAAAEIVTDGAVVDLSVFDNLIYYSNATNAKTANLDGTGVSVYGAVGTSFCKLNGFPCYLSAGVVLRGLVAVTGIIGTITAIAAVDTSLYILTSSIDNISTLYRYTVAGQVAVDPVVIATDVSGLAQHVIESPDLYLMLTNNNGVSSDAEVYFTATSVYLDTIFDYPINEFWEILAYTCGIAYTRKNSDEKKMALLTSRLTEMWKTFDDNNKRDEYQATRINNSYANMGGGGYPSGWST